MMAAELAKRSVELTEDVQLNLASANPVIPCMMRIEDHSAWSVLAQLRVTLRAGVPLRRFKIRDLLQLQEGQVFETLSPTVEDVPLTVGQAQLGWSEFEVLEQRLALRLTRLK